jgi:hypothetical protein
VESSGREKLMMDGKASKEVWSEIHSLEAHGINSAVWVWERAGHKGQGSSSGLLFYLVFHSSFILCYSYIAYQFNLVFLVNFQSFKVYFMGMPSFAISKYRNGPI